MANPGYVAGPSVEASQVMPPERVLLEYLANNAVEDARLFHLSLSEREQYFPNVRAVHRLLSALYTKDYTEVYPALRNYEWDEILAPLINKIESNHRKTMMKLMSAAYCKITVQKAAAYLGLPKDEALPILEKEGWTLLSPEILRIRDPEPDEAIKQTEHLKNFARYAVQLSS